MSTMLKTAAMSLLSKTLQTFLHKYLLEVDVEGVAMPSLIDVDGHSGWGVRLCNVKLREGVMLMTLPGKHKVKRKRRIRRKKEAKKQQQQQQPGKTEDKNGVNDSNVWSRQGTTGKDDSPKGEKNVSSRNGPSKSFKASPIAPSPRNRMMTEDETEMESTLSSRVPSPSILCRTSVTGAITGCLSRGGEGGRKHESDDEGEVEVISSPPSRGLPRDFDHTKDSLVKNNVVFDTQALEGSGSHAASKRLFKPIIPEDEQDNVRTNNGTAVHVETVTEDKEGIEGEESMESEQDFEYEEYIAEEDMVLCLGKAGRIGVLDVRLVGKELHVMIEDAFLTVEACPKPEELDDTSVRTSSTADTTKDDASKAKKKEKEKKKAPAPAKKAETDGERVLESSPLARAISAIPHLLLRDVTIRLIVRSKADDPDDDDEREQIGPDDSVVECVVEMLSVTSGDDILENFRNDEAGNDDLDESTLSLGSSKRVSLRELEERDENEYLTKRIRTGKGPEGGISINIRPPQLKTRVAPRVHDQPDWAFQSYFARTQFCILRCSGLDIQTRIFLGKEKDVALRTKAYAWYGDEYDDYTIDSMLFGVDYIAPAPKPLPPLQNQDTARIERKIKPEIERYSKDENGIQSNKVHSCFHKVARGLTPILCQKDHLPSEQCTYCWENSARPNSYSEHPLDLRTPLPGIVFNLALNDPFEINIDRQALQVIGSLQDLFGIKEEETSITGDSDESVAETKPTKTSIVQTLKDMSKGLRKEKKESLRVSFPSYMAPETIEIVGIFVSRINLRVHILKGGNIFDQGLGFRYWEATLHCTTIDLQQHVSKEKEFRDVRCGLGYFETNDYFGVERRKLLSLGLPKHDESQSELISSSKATQRCWPSTAAVLLQIPATQGAAAYESLEHHGVQIRFFSLGTPDTTFLNTTLNARVGPAYLDLPSTFPDDTIVFIEQMEAITLGNSAESQATTQETFATPTSNVIDTQIFGPALMKYTVRLDGGKVKWAHLIEVCLPILKVTGELSSDSEVFLETVINQVKVQYGKQSRLEKPEPEFSLCRLAQLPEDVRLRILLCLKDLDPLEKALGVKRESSSFMRCRSVNKAIVKVAKKSQKAIKRKKSGRLAVDSKPSKHEILNDLMKLDEESLFEIWNSQNNRSRIKGAAKKRPSSEKFDKIVK